MGMYCTATQTSQKNDLCLGDPPPKPPPQQVVVVMIHPCHDSNIQCPTRFSLRGLIFVLLHIIGVTEAIGIGHMMLLFADDILLCRVIWSIYDHIFLQDDLNSVQLVS